MTSHPELWGTGDYWEELGYPEHAAWEGKVAATKLNLSSLGKSLEDSRVGGWEAEKESVGFSVVSYKGTLRFPEPLLSLFKVLHLHSHRNPGLSRIRALIKGSRYPVSTRAQARRGTPRATGCSYGCADKL